jgi:hypothetical protein
VPCSKFTDISDNKKYMKGYQSDPDPKLYGIPDPKQIVPGPQHCKYTFGFITQKIDFFGLQKYNGSNGTVVTWLD